MARQKNDGRGRMGGRQKGTPNKVTTSIREWVEMLIRKNMKKMEKDMQELDGVERLRIMERLLQYVLPKQQAIQADVNMDKLTDEQMNTLVYEMTKDIHSEEEEDDGDTT